MINIYKKYNLGSAFFIILFITIWRIYFLYQNKYNLYGDEAQYWDWSRNLAFGYYSKPPFIAWVIRFTTMIFGDGEFGVRIASPIFHASTAIIIYFISNELSSDNKISFYSAISYITLPIVSLSSSLISTDSLLLFFWSISILFFIKAIKSNYLFYWILLGASAGLGLLAKYNMALFALSALVYLIITKQIYLIIKNYKFYLSLIIAISIYLPNLIWNYNHNFVSYLHTKEISRIDHKYFYPKNLLEFLSAQILIISPLLSYIFIKSLKNIRMNYRSDIFKISASFFLPMLIIIIFLSMVGKALANWAAPSVITIIIWVVYYQIFYQKNIKLLIISMIFNSVISLVFYNYDKLFAKEKISLITNGYITRDPFVRLYGWQNLAIEIEKIHKLYPNIPFLVGDRKLLTELNYYLRDDNVDLFKFNNSKIISNHYDMTRKIDDMIGSDFIYINIDNSHIDKYFEKNELIGNIEINLYGNYKLKYNAYILHNFLGYQK